MPAREYASPLPTTCVASHSARSCPEAGVPFLEWCVGCSRRWDAGRADLRRKPEHVSKPLARALAGVVERADVKGEG